VFKDPDSLVRFSGADEDIVRKDIKIISNHDNLLKEGQ
jgi:hypothetical protein